MLQILPQTPSFFPLPVSAEPPPDELPEREILCDPFIARCSCKANSSSSRTGTPLFLPTNPLLPTALFPRLEAIFTSAAFLREFSPATEVRSQKQVSRFSPKLKPPFFDLTVGQQSTQRKSSTSTGWITVVRCSAEIQDRWTQRLQWRQTTAESSGGRLSRERQ